MPDFALQWPTRDGITVRTSKRLVAHGTPAVSTCYQFGVSDLPNLDVLVLNGSAVHKLSTLSNVEFKLQSANLQGQLTMINFTATLYGTVI